MKGLGAGCARGPPVFFFLVHPRSLAGCLPPPGCPMRPLPPWSRACAIERGWEERKRARRPPLGRGEREMETVGAGFFFLTQRERREGRPHIPRPPSLPPPPPITTTSARTPPACPAPTSALSRRAADTAATPRRRAARGAAQASRARTRPGRPGMTRATAAWTAQGLTVCSHVEGGRNEREWRVGREGDASGACYPDARGLGGGGKQKREKEKEDAIQNVPRAQTRPPPPPPGRRLP